MDNYVAIKVRADDGAKPDLTDLKAYMERLNGQVAEARAKVNTAEADAPLAALQAKLDAIGKRVASPRIDMAGASRAIAQLTAVDAALHHTEDEAGKSGQGAGRRFADGFVSYASPPMSKAGLISGGILSGLAAMPALAAVGGAVAGTAFAAKFLIGTKKAQGPLYSEAQGFMKTVDGVMKNAVSPLIGPLKSAMSQLGGFLAQIGGQLKAAFAAVGPLIQPLVYGLEGLVGGILPGFISLMKAAAPAMQAFSFLLGSLGADLGKMFSAFAPAVSASADVLKMLGGLLNGLLPVLGKLAAALASSLAPVLAAFGKALTALTPVLLTIGKIFGDLAGAILTSLSGALTAVAQVIQGIAPAFGVLAGVLSQVFTAMENTGVFGILENLLENIAGPLGKMIGLLVSGLAPILGLVVNALMKVSNALLTGLTSAIEQLMPALVPLIGALVKLAVTVLVPLLPPLTQLALALVKILLSVTPLLPPLVQLITLLVGLATQALVPVTKAITVAAAWLTRLAGVIAMVIGWVARIIGVGLKWISNLANIKQVVGEVAGWITSHWDSIVRGAERMFHNVITFFERLPGRIISALGNVGTMLWNAGASIVKGLVHGMESQLDSARHEAAHLADNIAGFFGLSPAREGPLSGQGAPQVRGEHFAADIASGMRRGTRGVRSSALDLASNLVAHPSHGGPGGGRGRLELTMRLAGGGNPFIRELVRALKIEVREMGGDPDMFNRKVAFR